MNEPMSLLEVRDLHVGFQGYEQSRHVLSGVDLTVRQGEVVGLVAESGSGKSILASAVIGLLPFGARVLSGEILLRGQNLVGMSERDLRSVRGSELAMIVANPRSALNPVLRVGTQITNVLRARERVSRAVAADRGIALLESVGINDAARRVNSHPHELSGGMAQRVVIALALASAPQLLIADEPSSGLDVTVQAQVLDLIRKQTLDRGMSVILATRDLGVIAQYCDEVAVMYAGQIVEQASVVSFFEAPRHPYSKALVSAFRPVPTEHARTSSVQELRRSAASQGCRYNMRCPIASVVCRDEAPLMRPVGSGHAVRCHAYEATPA